MSAASRLSKQWRRAKSPSRFEAGLDQGFTREVVSRVEDGERLLGCIQCGTCSGACPLSAFMDATPRRLMEMIRSGARDEVLSSSTIWICASCHACAIECPKEIPITEVMHTLRRMSMDAGAYPRHFTNPVMMQELTEMAEDRGRSTEVWVAAKSYLRTDPMELPKHAGVGMKLMRRGRMGLKREKIRDRAGLKKLLEAVGS